MIKAIIFDIGGVVYVGKQKAHNYIQEKLKLDDESWFSAIEGVWDDLVKGIINEERGLDHISKKLGINKKKLRKVWTNAYKKRFRLNMNLLKMIKKIKKKYKTAVLSDQWAISYKKLINQRIIKSFDVLVFSNQVKTRKPEQKIYKIALERLKEKPSECIYIDNNYDLLIPAKKLGMKTIQFKNNNQLEKDLNKLGVRI